MSRKITATLLSLTLCSIGMIACGQPANPFESPSTLPLEAPPFDKIKTSDYMPAFEQGMKQQLAEVEKIANNPEPATFDNTIAALEKSGRMLERVSQVFFALTQANTNETLDELQQSITPMLAAHKDAIFFNEKLFGRISILHQTIDNLSLDQESKQLIRTYYNQFVHAGAELDTTSKQRIKDLNKQLASLETLFQQKLIAGSKKAELVVSDKKLLDGLSDQALSALEKPNDNGTLNYVISIHNTTQQPLLDSLTNRSIRETLFQRSWTRTEMSDDNDTREIITQLASMRAEKAKLLGYDNFSSYNLYDQMAKSPVKVHDFLNQLIPPTTKRINLDEAQIQALIDKTNHFDLKAWDWDYYAEQVRKELYDLDQSEVMPYFELNHVLKDGIFYAANQLYGITFKERHDLPVYHPDVRVFDVFDHDNSQLGLIYLDYFKRDNKAGGAWMNNFVVPSTVLGTKPVIYNVTNFTKPAPGNPALLTSDDVRTMFHEFGHALHGLFANTKYPLSNSNIARDFVEMPSQFNEHWALYPSVLKHYAKHYKTGEVIPDALAEKIKKSESFNQGYSLGEILAASELDLYWHELTSNNKVNDTDTFESQALKASHTDFANVPPRYRSSYFLHIWANGYASSYYAYLWSEMLDDNIYEWFTEHGGLTRSNGQRFRDLVLSRGSSDDYDVIFKSFNGKEPSIEPLLKHRGV